MKICVWKNPFQAYMTILKHLLVVQLKGYDVMLVEQKI